MACGAESDGQTFLLNFTSGVTDDNRYYIGGRVEICYNGSPGTICDLGWSDTNANVLCSYFLSGTNYTNAFGNRVNL